MPISDYLADAILNDLFRTTGFTPAGTVYAGLAFADPGRVFDPADELPAAGGYGRVAITKGDARWSAPATVGDKREITNLLTIDFGTASATWNAGNPVGYWFLSDSGTVGGGNMWGSGAIDVPKAITAGDPITFPPGTLRIRF